MMLKTHILLCLPNVLLLDPTCGFVSSSSLLFPCLNITILKLWLFLFCDHLGVVLFATNTSCCQMSLQFPTSVKSESQSGTLREACIVCALSLPFLQSLITVISCQRTVSVAQTELISLGQSGLTCPYYRGIFSLAFHINAFLSSCIQEAEQLCCHLFISTSTVYLFRFLVNATFFF